MFLSIRHTTSYLYEDPVVLEPHTLRLTPRADSYRRLVERSLTIIPEPDGASANLDCNGSLTHLVWFNRQTSSLMFISRSVLELNEFNPFDFIVYPSSCVDLPMQYPACILAHLKPYFSSRPAHSRVKDFALELMRESKCNVVEFASLLCQRIKEICAYEVRDQGEALPAEEVLLRRRGSCRDLAVLYITAARAVGLAARFVSGYYFDQSPKHPQLHAWVEIYIPGGGWRGYDPTLGLACYGHHVVLAAGATPAQTAAIEGSFLGRPESQMVVSIEYEYLKQPLMR